MTSSMPWAPQVNDNLLEELHVHEDSTKSVAYLHLMEYDSLVNLTQRSV